ncbi:zinc finger protein 414 isoform X4 [Dermochelys coriacea]|uniref:zinc finger protein 414 isoform X4 n=1 Tax=Dermochelys coriacea TaxID=27794 RepID=UPI001CA8C4AD|nr:zinc finger protein 414 isoform X4 [Dermochelys coriacea]
MHHQEKSPSPVPGIARSATALAYHEHYTSPSPVKSKALKTEKDAALPSFSLDGYNDPAVSGSQMHPTGSGGSGAQAQDLGLPKRRPLPGKHYQCSSYGCKLAFHSMQELMDHMRVHYRPTQSLEGKIFHCPTQGCTETFPSMQDLVAHMKVHYKPNRYFKCENCLVRFRTHRSLFKHLHVCSDSASSPAPAHKAEKPPPPATSSLEKDPPAKPPEGLPKLQSVIRHMEKEAILPGMDAVSTAVPASLPTSLPGLHGSLESMPLVSPASHPFPLLEPSLFGPSALTRFSGQPHSTVPGPFLSYMHPSPYSLPQASVQHRLRPYLPSPGLPVSNAVWKKSQGENTGPAGVCVGPRLPCFGSGVTSGHSSNSRIVWEHTRGRYTCMQCPYSSASREEMTLHIEDQHKNPPLPSRLDGEMDFGVGLASFHSKLPPEMENSLYSQL